jgi:hypothetical protein
MTRSELDRMRDAAHRIRVTGTPPRTVANGAEAYNDDVTAFRELVDSVKRALQVGLRLDAAVAEEIRAGFERLQEHRALLERDETP